jgi:hypothetical protein
MAKSKKASAGVEKAGLLKRFRRRAFKEDVPAEPERSHHKRQAYGMLDCIRMLAARQDKGWEGQKMGNLLRLDEQKNIFGREGSTSYFCNSEHAPVLILEASPKSPSSSP